jgi:hypothetical protein
MSTPPRLAVEPVTQVFCRVVLREGCPILRRRLAPPRL